MEKNYLNKSILLVLIGICLVLTAIFTESVLDGLFWGLAGGALGMGISMIIKYIYWSSPKNIERYREIAEKEDINLHDELNEKIRDKAGRMAYLTGLIIICVSEVVFSILGKIGAITDHKIIVLYLIGLLVIQIMAWSITYNHHRKKYS